MNDFLIGAFSVAVVLFIVVAVYPAFMAALAWLLNRKWGRR